jgi:hypothetical protein
MAETIAKLVIKKTSEANLTPLSSALEFGELALNYADRLLFFKDSSGNVATIDADNSYIDDADVTIPNTFTDTNTFNNKTIFNAGIDLNHIVLDILDNSIVYDGSLANYATVTLTENATLNNITNANVGTYTICIKQDSGGYHELYFDTDYNFRDGIVPIISAAPNSINLITVVKLADSDNLHIIDFQSNMVRLSDFIITTQPQGAVSISGIYQTGIKSLILIGDINGMPAWHGIYGPYGSSLVRWVLYSSSGGSNYFIETYTATTADPYNWVLSTGIRFSGGGQPWITVPAGDHTPATWNTDWTNLGTWPGDPELPSDPVVSIDTYVEAVYLLSVTSLGTTTDYGVNSGASANDVSQLFGNYGGDELSDWATYFYGPYPFSANPSITNLRVDLKTSGTYAGKYVIGYTTKNAYTSVPESDTLTSIAYNTVDGLVEGTYVGIIDSQLTFEISSVP